MSCSRVAKRGLSELTGLCKGIMADGRLAPEEFEYLVSWLNNNWAVQDCWPANVIVERIERILSDHRVDEEELQDLAETLRTMLGAQPVFGYQGAMATRLPLDHPEPEITFAQKKFVLTGKFLFGSRARCAAAIEERGGKVLDSVSADVHYVVIGAIGSRDWAESTHGRKIEKAVQYRDGKKLPLAIVAEEHWVRYVGVQ